ncbi:hypothetical protein [Candidatus Deianiraea vastatrix]|uniref:Uncharacterized protein n=1 Tax=Candidatus Deianiraea vastatrix TaxID=2163644 RepID=A0A5B8XFA6_9RICK|nr:hypothetical protein [Candidatus Deianiraea vastatrix]QED23114.1 hypothetical protein Deia_00307 [Candidatus Deianiraea vastatrix]
MLKYFFTLIILCFYSNNVSAEANHGYKDNPLPWHVEPLVNYKAGVKLDLGIQLIVTPNDMDDDNLHKCLMLGQPGDITGHETNDAAGDKTVWIDEASYSEYDITVAQGRLCVSQCQAAVKEKCITLETTRAEDTYKFPSASISTLYTEDSTFTLDDIGDNLSPGDDDDRYGHRVGYVYNLFSGRCPYNSTTNDDECLLQQSISGEVTMEYYKGVKMNRDNNCYESVKDIAQKCPQVTGCPCVDSDVTGKCSQSTNYIPHQKGEYSGYWMNLKQTQKMCFLCYSTVRQRLAKCKRASYDVGIGYGPNNNYSKAFHELMDVMRVNPPKFFPQQNASAKVYQVFRNLYGPGRYVCGYEYREFTFSGQDDSLSNKESNRVGCRKIAAKTGPRPFPRIAQPLDAAVLQKITQAAAKKTSSSSVTVTDPDIKYAYMTKAADNIFGSSPAYKPFNDLTEVGEVYRGDFFNPSINLTYGKANYTIWFDPPNTSNFADKFIMDDDIVETLNLDPDIKNGDPRFIKEMSKISKWSTDLPKEIQYAASFDTKGNPVKNSSIVARICSRIEYIDSREETMFVAYYIDNKFVYGENGFPLENNIKCNDALKKGMLKILGGTVRPPLKFSYINKKTVTPIVLSASDASDTTAITNIKIDPSVIGGYYDEITKKIISFTDANGKLTPAGKSIASRNVDAVFTPYVLSALQDVAGNSSASQGNQQYGQVDSNSEVILFNHLISIGPYYQDCYGISMTSGMVRESIRMKVVDSVGKCNGDKRCIQELILFLSENAGCQKLKRCKSSDDPDSCAKSGKLQIKLDKPVDEYINNIEWLDGVCVVRGMRYPDFIKDDDSLPNGSGLNRTLYGQYPNSFNPKVTRANSQAISFKQKYIDTPQIALYLNGGKGPGPDNILSPSEKYYQFMDPDSQINDLAGVMGSDLMTKYFGCSTSSCLKNKVSVRNKTNDEMGLCVTFDRVNQVDYGVGRYAGGLSYNHYIPYRCEYMEAEVLGAGGKSEQWNNDARVRFKTQSVAECVGYTAMCTFLSSLFWGPGCAFSLGFANCPYIDGTTKNCCSASSACFDFVQKACEKMLQSGSGAGGGYVYGILDVNAIDRDALIVSPGIDNSSNINFNTLFNSSFASENKTTLNNRLESQVEQFDIGGDSVIWRNTSNSKSGVQINRVMAGHHGGKKYNDESRAYGGAARYNSAYLLNSGYFGNQCSALPPVPSSAIPPDAPSADSGKFDEAKFPNYSEYKAKASTNKCVTEKGSSGKDYICYDYGEGESLPVGAVVLWEGTKTITTTTPADGRTRFCECGASVGAFCQDHVVYNEAYTIHEVYSNNSRKYDEKVSYIEGYCGSSGCSRLTNAGTRILGSSFMSNYGWISTTGMFNNIWYPYDPFKKSSVINYTGPAESGIPIITISDYDPAYSMGNVSYMPWGTYSWMFAEDYVANNGNQCAGKQDIPGNSFFIFDNMDVFCCVMGADCVLAEKDSGQCVTYQPDKIGNVTLDTKGDIITWSCVGAGCSDNTKEKAYCFAVWKPDKIGWTTYTDAMRKEDIKDPSCTTTTTVKTYQYCSPNQACINEQNKLNDATSQAKADTAKLGTYTQSRNQYVKDAAKYDEAMKASLDVLESQYLLRKYNGCFSAITGDDGEYDWPSRNNSVKLNGGGNRAIKMKNVISNSCIPDKATNKYTDLCTQYRMIHQYCDVNTSSASCDNGNGGNCTVSQFNSGVDLTKASSALLSTLKAIFRPGDRDYTIKSHPFIGSGGCAIDHNDADNLTSYDTMDNTGTQMEAYGGDGRITLTIPYTQFKADGITPILYNGKKKIDKANGIRDVHCMPRCPRAFVQIGNYICEYSNGDPYKGYESKNDDIIKPLKCFDSTGKIYIPESANARVCLFTKCSSYKTNYRHYGFCTDNDFYNGALYVNGAAFYTDLVSDTEVKKYCGSIDAKLNQDYRLDANIDSSNDYSLTCDDHGNWRKAADGTLVTSYMCPMMTLDVKKFLNTNIFNYTTSLNQVQEFSKFSNGTSYCGGYGIYKPMPT